MSAFNEQDLKDLGQLAGAVKRAHFKDLTPGEIVGIAKAFEFMASLGQKIERNIKYLEFIEGAREQDQAIIAELNAKLIEPVKKAKK